MRTHQGISQRALLLALLLTFVLAACHGRERQQPSVPVIPYIRLSPETITVHCELPGRISAFVISEVRPQVGGIIQERLFEEGSEVQAGQVLYQIDPVLYQAAFNNAKAHLAKARSNEAAARLLAQRRTVLVKAGAVSAQDHDDAMAAYGQVKAEIHAAEEALETARIHLNYTKVTAPISGRIGRSFVTPGALVTQNQAGPLATVQQINLVYVDVTQSSAELLRIRRDLAHGRLRTDAGNTATVRLYLEDGTPYARSMAETGNDPDWIEGKLLFSDITVDQSTSVVSTRVLFANPQGILLPGMYVRAVIEEGTIHNAVLVPQKSVHRDTRNRPQVYVLTKDNPNAEAQQEPVLGEHEFYVAVRPIRIDRDYGNRWLVIGGLAPGDLLVADGLLHVRPGMVVSGKEVTDASAMPAAAQAHIPAGR